MKSKVWSKGGDVCSLDYAQQFKTFKHTLNMYANVPVNILHISKVYFLPISK